MVAPTADAALLAEGVSPEGGDAGAVGARDDPPVVALGQRDGGCAGRAEAAGAVGGFGEVSELARVEVVVRPGAGGHVPGHLDVVTKLAGGHRVAGDVMAVRDRLWGCREHTGADGHRLGGRRALAVRHGELRGVLAGGVKTVRHLGAVGVFTAVAEGPDERDRIAVRVAAVGGVEVDEQRHVAGERGRVDGGHRWRVQEGVDRGVVGLVGLRDLGIVVDRGVKVSVAGRVGEVEREGDLRRGRERSVHPLGTDQQPAFVRRPDVERHVERGGGEIAGVADGHFGGDIVSRGRPGGRHHEVGILHGEVDDEGVVEEAEVGDALHRDVRKGVVGALEVHDLFGSLDARGEVRALEHACVVVVPVEVEVLDLHLAAQAAVFAPHVVGRVVDLGKEVRGAVVHDLLPGQQQVAGLVDEQACTRLPSRTQTTWPVPAVS